MSELEELLARVRKLNDGRKCQEAIDLLLINTIEDYQSADLYAELAEAYYRIGQNILSDLYVERSIFLDDQNNKAWYWKGAFFLDKKDYENAILCYNKIIKINYMNPSGYNGLGNVFKSLGHYDIAKYYYERAVKFDESYYLGYYNLGRINRSLNNYIEAKKLFLESIKIESNYAYSYNELGNLYYYDLDDTENGEFYYLLALEKDAKLKYVHCNLGDLYLGSLDYQKSALYYKQAIELDSNYIYALSQSGILHYEHLGDYKLAKTYFQEVIERNELHKISHHYLGILHRDLKNYELAKIHYFRVLDIDPDYAPAYTRLGNLFYYDLKDYDQGKYYYELATEKDPLDKFPNYNLGNIYRDLKDYQKAEYFYLKSIEIDSKFAHGYNGLGCLYHYDLSKSQIAEDYFRMALESEKNFKYSNYNLGNLFKDLKDYPKAISFCEKAIANDKNYSKPYFTLGVIYEELSQFKKAVEFYKLFLKFNDNVRNDFFTDIAFAKIDILNDVAYDFDFKAISELVKGIKSTLQFHGNHLTHYTSASISRFLIMDNSSFRISEASFLNDTSEGTEIFRFLDRESSKSTNNHIITKEKSTAVKYEIDQRFVQKPFIGSFVSEQKDNDLALWRMYGKENGQEAKGCAITINTDKFIDQIESLLIGEKTGELLTFEQTELKFYHVAYLNKERDYFSIPSMEGVELILNDQMKKLRDRVKIFRNRETVSKEIFLRVNELLSEIAYLFKSIEYQYEYELRLIINQAGYIKIVDSIFTPPKVYINLVPIRSAIKKVTLGPKLEKPEEWKTAFYYSLLKDGLESNISISKLPFK